MSLPKPAPAGSVLTDEQIAAAVPLLDAGASLRQIANALGCSRHQARILAAANKGEEPKPRVKRTIETPATPIATFPTAPLALAPQPQLQPEEPSAPLFADLEATRRELKAQLDRAARMGNRQAVSSYSLALARLEDTADPGRVTLPESQLRLDLLPDSVLEFVRLAVKTITPASDGDTLTTEVERLTAALFYELCDQLHAVFKSGKPLLVGEQLTLAVTIPDALVLQPAKDTLDRLRNHMAQQRTG